MLKTHSGCIRIGSRIQDLSFMMIKLMLLNLKVDREVNAADTVQMFWMSRETDMKMTDVNLTCRLQNKSFITNAKKPRKQTVWTS
jgi:hypothetical protein